MGKLFLPPYTTAGKTGTGKSKNRARFACEAVAAVRRALPDITIDFKLAVRQENPHYGNAGILMEELPVFVPLLEQAGVNSFMSPWPIILTYDTIPPASHPDSHGEGRLSYCNPPPPARMRRVGRLCSPDFVKNS